MKLITNTGKEFKISWIGVATIDGALRFCLIDSDVSYVVQCFLDEAETARIVREYDSVETEYSGFTKFKTIDVQPDGTIIVALSKENGGEAQ